MRRHFGKTLLLLASVIVTGHASAAVNVDYRNFDSTDRTFEAICSGSRASISFRSNTTGSATLQGSAPCVIKQGSDEVILKGGEDVEIKNGEITIV